MIFRSGILQVGDRILAINGQILEGMSIEDARSLIKRSNSEIHLEIEFDVTGKTNDVIDLIFIHMSNLDSVMLSSGICQVKILRKNFDLGLSVTCMSSIYLSNIVLI